jgi:hypothetical protein
MELHSQIEGVRLLLCFEDLHTTRIVLGVGAFCLATEQQTRFDDRLDKLRVDLKPVAVALEDERLTAIQQGRHRVRGQIRATTAQSHRTAHIHLCTMQYEIS